MAETRPRVGFFMPVGKMVEFALELVKIYEEKKLEVERVAGARIFKNLLCSVSIWGLSDWIGGLIRSSP